MTSAQIPLSLSSGSTSQGIPPLARCHKLWDNQTARFTTCALPYIATVPAILSAFVLLTYSLRIFRAHQPRWAKPFIKEEKESPDELSSISTFWRRPLSATFGLLLVSMIGLKTQILASLLPSFSFGGIYPSVAWVITIGIIVMERPRTASLSLLVTYTGLFFEGLVMLSHTQSPLDAQETSLIIASVASLLCIFIVLNMPLRDPALPQDGISPVFTAPTVKLRTPEDNLSPLQYMTVSWMRPLISKGKTRNMGDEDVWDLGYEFKHERLHSAFRVLQGSVTKRIFVANAIDLVITTSLGLLQLAATLSIPVLLQQLLASMQNPNSSGNVTITYACIALLFRLINAQSQVFALWHQRRAYERSRGEMVTMLYEKTLNRKILGAKQEPIEEQSNGHDDSEANGTANGSTIKGSSHFQQVFGGPFRFIRNLFKRKPAEPEKKEDAAASMGKILNLMRNDVYEVSQRFWEFSDIITKPVGVIFATLLIWRMLGWSCLLGVLALFITQSLNVVLARYKVYFEKKRRLATDEKLKRINQFIESIRHLRWYGWQDSWLNQILESRQKELHLRVILIVFETTLALIVKFGVGLFPLVAFYAYTKLSGKSLRVDLIFPAIDLFNLLDSYLRELPRMITTLLNAYVAMGRIEKFMQEPDKEQGDVVPEGSAELSLRNASFAWPGVDKNVLEDITLTFPRGLTVIYGEVASGKTALFQALLGELNKTAGDFIQPDEVIGYCAQTPWLQSMSIRDNILFSYPYEEARYKQVLEACALLPDMGEFKHGDLSNIGENGIGLSGGQKARVALARAVYSKAKVIMLDDPLSALDHQTAEFIVRTLLAGPLLADRTTILVTHRTELCHGIAKQWVELNHGKASIHEPAPEEENALKRQETEESISEEEAKKREEAQAAAVPDKFIEDEHRATGTVKLHVYWRYIKAGTFLWWSLAIFVMVFFRLVDVGQGWFVKAWGEGYDYDYPRGTFDFLPPPAEDVVPWLVGFFVFVCVSSVTFWWVYIVMYGVGYQASKTIFREAVDRVAHATFRFYDVTPVGRLMNRLTSDMNTIDGHLGFILTLVIWQFVGFVSSIVIILSAAPAFLVFGVLLSACYAYYFRLFLPTSQTLRRLEMVSLSPLMSNFGALVEGLTTVRAFSAQPRFQSNVITVVDNFQAKDHFYWSLQAWLGLRFSTLSASSTLAMAIIAVYTGISPGLTAFVLVTASKFVVQTEQLCKIYGQLEMDFTSVERVVELLDLETEAPGVVDPPAHWPSYTGDIVFSNVTMRYAPNLEPALQDVTLRIPAGSHTAVIGRTGSGKSTLALSLLGTLAPEAGQIFIDGVDIATVNKQALRSRVTFLAQDPVLFPGTLRANLDPLSEHSDAECAAVLEKIAPTHSWTLSMRIEGGGKGLSQGQRQLVGLARAMLRRTAVLIMDEATASIDFETAQRIQRVLREEMHESTVITIAHRLEAVKSAEYCVVLGKGRVLRQGRAEEMLREGGEFVGMLAG
ncbi:ABC bile acid transporter-like protein [Bimuria novae-zelandiae CBS 107.79]|uniref:ABC bile acid transporter-like protein n=1 Tax=Bimuria novae-zelandiae CBS 107.79 TaxID=1447943 RepID=A0A6A5VU98_9PLEO|nr:ABC bile acid transporter-like protein [Bimuria novae-zelandiae CBS 107.79]